MRMVRFLIGLFLFPVCWAVTIIAVRMAGLVGPESDNIFSPAALAFIGGFVVWIFIYLVLPRPVRTYIIAHELTHALWGIFRGARVKDIRIAKGHGSVTLSRSDFLITLAPYFFPLYTVIIIIAYYVLSIFFEMEKYELYWIGLVGLTWGFHFSFTITTLLQKQSDIKAYGHMFSYAVIYLANITGISLWILLFSSVTIEQAVECWAWGWGSMISDFRMFFDAIKP